jgi:hypothetical protein
MPHVQSEMNMRRFADHVLPVLQNDEAFRRPVDLAEVAAEFQEKHEDVFAPA